MHELQKPSDKDSQLSGYCSTDFAAILDHRTAELDIYVLSKH